LGKYLIAATIGSNNPSLLLEESTEVTKRPQSRHEFHAGEPVIMDKLDTTAR